MLRDRGNIKWTSMMLPEHVKLLRHWSEEDYYHQVKPEIDEQQLEQFNEVICSAMEENQELVFTYCKDHSFHTSSGQVHYIDHIHQTIRIVSQETGSRLELPLAEIINIKQK